MSEAVRLHTRGPRPQPGTAAASGPPGPWCTAGSGPQAPSPAGAGGCRSLAVVCVPVSRASFPQEPLGPPACRPPARPSGAWTRLQPEAVARPLKGAPPAPRGRTPRPAPRCLPGLACTFSLQRMSPARPVPRPCSGPARDSCGKTQRLQAPVSLRTRHTPPRVLPPFCPSAK